MKLRLCWTKVGPQPAVERTRSMITIFTTMITMESTAVAGTTNHRAAVVELTDRLVRQKGC
jgi:hypothetical protein